MSTGKEKRQRKRATRVRRASRASANDAGTTAPQRKPIDEAARSHYQREKARRAERTRPPEHPLEQARRAYQALLAADAERAKGGRPKKDGPAAKRKPSPSAEPDANHEA
jgi:hypothetical protein